MFNGDVSKSSDFRNNLLYVVLGIVISSFVAGIMAVTWLDSRYVKPADLKEKIDVIIPSPTKPSIRDFSTTGTNIVEKDSKVDKRFYDDSDCQLGAVTAAHIGNYSEKSKAQPAICFCANGDAHGVKQGWFCID